MVHEQHALYVSVNDSNAQEARIPYTKGEWGYSYPVRLSIGNGDKLKIERKGPQWGLTVKKILLMNDIVAQTSDASRLHPPTANVAAAMKPESNIATTASNPFEKTVKVFILLGQSNMVGMGQVKGADKEGTLEHAVKTKHQYPFLVDDNGNWRKVINQRVRNVFIMGSGNGVGKLQKNEWMTVDCTNKIGPEIGIGYELGKWLAESPSCPCGEKDDILILKSCIGNRSLGWDLLPPGSPPFEYTDEKKKTIWHYAGYKESPNRWEKGTKPIPIGWVSSLFYEIRNNLTVAC